jgi:hypothetical protein
MSSCSQRDVPNQVPNLIFVVANLLYNYVKRDQSINRHAVWVRPGWLVSTLNSQHCEMNTLRCGGQEEYILSIMHHNCFRTRLDHIRL